MESGAGAPPSGTLAEALSDSRPEKARADIALSSLDAIDAQIHHKIGLLESLLGSCDGVLRRHDADALPSGAPWKGNNPVSVSAAAEGAHCSHGEPSVHGRSHAEVHEGPTLPHGHVVMRPVARMVEAARLLRAQRVLCKVTRQLCGARHAHCCLSSLRIHRLAEKQIRHAVAAEFGRSEVVRGLRLVSWVEESAAAQAFLGWHLTVVRRRDGAQERQRMLLIADVERRCLRAHVLRTWHRVAQDTLAACGKVQRLISFFTMRISLRRWVRLTALGRRAANTMRYQQARLWDIKRRSILNTWKRTVRERAMRFTRCACDGAFSALSTLRVRRMVGEMFLGWRVLRDCHRWVTQCTRRQSKAVMCLCRLRVWGKLRLVISNWRYKLHYKQRLQLVSVDVKMRCHLKLRRVAFHCWYAVRQEHKISAQKWWWENKLETLMKTIEVHEQSCSQQERTVQAYLDTSCRLEDRVAELRSNMDNVRSSRIKVRLKYSGFIRMLSFAAWRLYDSVRRQRFHHTKGSDTAPDMIGPLEPAQVSNNVQYDSSGAALIAVTFSVWLCALVSCQVRRLRAADLGRKVSSSNLQGMVGCWTSQVKKTQRLVKFESIISRRVNLSLSRLVMRCWSGTFFTYSTFLKIRKCRAMNILRRIVQARLVIHWNRWANFSVHTRRRALALQRSGRRNRRQLIFKFLGSWYLFSKVQQHRPSGESVLLDASHCLGFPARGQADDVDEATARSSLRAGIFEQAGTLHLLTEKEVELRDLRNQLCMRDENFAHLWKALADSENQIAVIQENLSSEMALSEMDQTAALERVQCLAMEKEQAEEMMKGLKASLLQLTEATEALKRDLDNARDQAAEARRELKTCKKDLQEAQIAMERKNELIDVSTGAISADILRNEANAEIRNTLVKYQSDACLSQLNVELEHAKAQLQARDVTERELRAVLAQRLEGDAVMELREERNVLRSELETLRRDLQSSVRELEICKGLVAEPRKSAKTVLEPKKDRELPLEERVADLNAHLKEKVAEIEARAQAAEEMCNAQLASLERMQSDVKGWQSKAEKHLAAKEEAEARAAEEISRAEERCQQLITKSQNEGQAQDIAAKQMLQDAQSERDEAIRKAESAGNELLQTCMLYDQAIERAEAAEDDLQQARQAREEEARKHEKTKAELQQAFDRERAQDEVIRMQKTCSGALESSLQEVKSTSAREAAAKDEVIQKQELKLNELKMQLKEAKAVAAKEVAAQQSRLTAASDALEKLRKENVQLEEELDSARLTAARASTEGAILQSSINDLRESRRQRENELLDKDEELRKLRREVAGHAALASAVEKLRRQNAQLDEELTAVRLKAEDASTEGRLLNSSLCSSTSAKQRIEHELANRSEELFKLQYQISGLSSQHESTQAKLSVSERLCQEQEGRIRALMAELQLVRAQRISDAQHAVPRRQESVIEFGTRYEDQIHTYTSHIEALKAEIDSVKEDAHRARHDRDQAVLGEERARDELKGLMNARGDEQGLVTEREGGVVMSVPNAEHEVERIRALTSEVERLRVNLAKAQEDALNSRYDRDSALSQNDTTKDEDVAQDQALSWRAVPGPGQQSGRSDYDARVPALTAEIQDLRRKLDDVERGAQEARNERENAAQSEKTALAELEVLRKQLAEAEGDVQQARSAHGHAMQGEKRALAELKKLSEVLQPKENVQTSKQKYDLAPATTGSVTDRSPEEGMRSKLQDANVEGRPSTSLMLNEEVGSMNSQLAASKNRQKPVDMIMKLGLNFSAAGEEGSTSRRFFEKSLVQDLANASGMAATNFKVRNMSPGSVIVDVRVFPDAAQGLDPEHVVKDLEAQADDAGSQLMNGILTRYTQSLTLSARPGSDSGFQSEQDIASPRGTYSDASQSLGVMTSTELLGNSDAEMIQHEGRMAREMAAQNAQHFVTTRENGLLVEDKQALEEKLKVTERELASKLEQLNELHDQVAQLAKNKKQMSAAAERDASAQAQELIRLKSELADHEVRRQNLEDQLKVAEQMCEQKEQTIHRLQAKLESVQAQISASRAGQSNQVANEGPGAVAGNSLLDPDESAALLEKGYHSSMAANIKTKEPVLQFSKRRDHPAVNVSSVGQMHQELVASEDSGEDLATFKDNEQDVAELQAKLNECTKEYATALSEKQQAVDNLLRERDVNMKELSNLRASLQDSTLALNATKRQLEHVCLERNTLDLPNTHSELEVAQQHVEELQAKLNTALSEKQQAVDNLLRERDVNMKELSNLRASLQDSTLALNATKRQLEHVCLERNTLDLPNTHSELEVAQQHVEELQAKLNTALSEKQQAVDNLLRERDVNMKELSNLRASLQDSTLALNATKRQLEHVCLERNTLDLPNTHSELEVEQRWKDALEARMQADLERKAADTKAAIARTLQTEEWSRVLNTLRAQLDAAEAKAAAASARAASMSEIHKIQHSKWSLQSNILQRQKEEADGRAHAAEKTVEALKNRIAKEREYVETQCQLSDALLQKTDLEVNSICGENLELQSYENLLTDLQSTRAQRDSWKRKAEACEAGARAETERCKEQETAMQAVVSVSHTLEETCKQWELVVQDLQAQRDKAEARAAASESRACNLEATIAANTAFLEDLCGQMDTARGNYRQFWACPTIGPEEGNQGSDELVVNFTAHSQDWESAWNEWRFHAETIRAQTEQKPDTAGSSAQDTCDAYLQALRVWAGKVQVLEEARLHWQARAESLTLGRDAAKSSASKCQNRAALVSASMAEIKKCQQTSVQALVERVYLLEKTCIEWQWNVHNIESQTQTPSSPPHMPGCSAHEMPVCHTLHHLQSRLDSLDTAFQVSTERCQELQVKLNTLCSCIERASGVSEEPFSISYERALRTILQLQTQESSDTFSHTAANQHFVDDGWRVAHGDERSRNSTPCSNVNAGIEALEHELQDFQAVFTKVVSKILASEEDMHAHILFLQKELEESHNQARENSIQIEDPQSLNETQKGSAVDIAAKGEEEEIGQQTINKDSLDEPARWEKVEHSQILETALDAALEQAADFKSKLDAAVELSDRCTQENDLMRRRIEECKEDLDATLEQSRLADDKQREQADSLQRMNVTIETLQQSCNMWEMISVQMTERAENAERKVDEQHAFMLSMSKVVDKLEKSCLWWEALAGEMKDTADVAESHLFDVEKRIESMDDAYRSVWEDRLRWKERAEFIAAENEVAVTDAREELVSDLSAQMIMTQDLQALAQRLMLERDNLAQQLRLETQTVCKLKGTCAELDNKLHDLIHQNQRLEDVCFEWQVKADSLSAKYVRAESDLTEVQTLLIGASELCTLHEESVRIVANAAKDLVKDNSKLVRADLAQVAAIQSLSDLVLSLEDSCLRWQNVTEKMSMDNASCHQRLLEMATERDEAFIDRDEARTEFARAQTQADRELKEQSLANSKLTSAIQALTGILESLEQSCSSLASELGPWQANWDVLASELGSESKFWESKFRKAEIERDTAHHVALQAQEKGAQYEIDIQALRVLVKTLESSCHTWEELVKEISLTNEACQRQHMQQLQDACNSEFKSNQEWSRKVELLEQERCKRQIEVEAHGALRDAAASELLLASNEIESLEIVLRTAYLKCQELVAYVGILMKQRERIENLSEAWRERAEQVGREKTALESAIKRACAHMFDWRRAVAAHQEAALNMEQEAANAERVWQETAEDLDRAQNLFLQEIEQLTKERNSVLERAQEREGAVQRAVEAEEQIQPWFEGAGDKQTIKLQQERDAALERAMAAEEMIQIWQQKMDGLERVWMEWRMQVEEMQQQSELSQQELVAALARAGKPEAATSEKDYLESLLTTVQRDQKTSQEVHRMQEEYMRSVAFLQKQVRSLKSRLEVDDQSSVSSSREHASRSGSSHEEMQQVEALLKKETEACEGHAKAETKSASAEQVAAFEGRSQQLVEENLLLSERVKNAAECAAGELEAVGTAVLAHIQSLYNDPEHTNVEGTRIAEDFYKTLEILQNRIGSLTAELADVRAQLIEQGPVFEESMEQVEARGAQNVAMQNSLQNAKDEIQQLQSELEHKTLALQLEATLTKGAQNSVESLTARMSELQKQNSAMGWALEATQEKCSRQQEKILALEQACDDWRECTHSERAVADVLRKALKDSSHASTLDLSLVVQSEALRSSISELRQQFDVLISQKSSAEILCDASLLEGEENGSADTEHTKYLAGLHYQAEVLLHAFSTCTSELEIVMGGLQLQFGHHEQQVIKTQRELEKVREDLRLRQLEYDEQRLQYKANAEAATRAQIESREAFFSLQSKLQECEAGNAELQARVNENHDDKILWKYVAEKADRNNAELQEAQEQLQVRLAKLMEELAVRERQAQEALAAQIELDRIKTELQTDLNECREERMQWKSKTEQLQAELDDLQQETQQLTAENEQVRAAQKTKSDELANQLLECQDDRSMWRGKSEQLQQLYSEWQESEAQLQAKLAECEADLSLSARKVEAAALENAEIAAQLEAMRLTMQKAHETIPVAVALTLECDYDDTLADARDVASFNEGLVTDLHTALGVPKSTVQVLCHQRGSVIAEIVLRSCSQHNDGQGSTLTGQELATRLQDLLSTADGPLRRSPTGCFAKKVDIHGPIAEGVVSAVDSAVQEAARRQEQSKQTERELLARVRDCEYVRQTQNVVFERQENEIKFLSEREDEYLEAMSRAMLELETSLDTLESQLHLRVQSEASLQAARLSLGDQSIVHYVETPTKASPEFFTSEEIKHARSRVLMYSVLDIRRARHLQRQCMHMLGVLVRRQECLREVSAMLLKGFYEHVLCNVVIKWRSLKRRQQHRRRIAQNKVEVVTAPLLTRRLLADSFLWWWAIANRPSRLRFFPEPVPPPHARDTSRFLPNTLPKSSPRITTPRESLGAVASAGAAMTPRRHPGVDGRSPPSVAGVVIWNLPESAGV